MITKILIKIGHESKILQSKILGKKPKHEKEENNIIEKKTIKKIIKKENKRKNNKIQKYLIILVPILTLLSPQNTLNIILLTVIILLLKKAIPKIKEDKKQKEILKKLPYVLRQISTELKAGMGLFDAMKTIANGNYGSISQEFNITLTEIKYGENYEKAFKNLSKRTKLEIMDKVTSQIIRTLNNGGNLADILNSLADENSYNLRLKYKEYSEKLNAIMLLYMFIAVLLPVILFIMIIAATTVMGSIIKPELLLILYLFFFPLIITFMILLIKRMEPTI